MAKIEAMQSRLLELQDSDSEAKELRSRGVPKGWDDVDGILQ